MSFGMVRDKNDFVLRELQFFAFIFMDRVSILLGNLLKYGFIDTMQSINVIVCDTIYYVLQNSMTMKTND